MSPKFKVSLSTFFYLGLQISGYEKNIKVKIPLKTNLVAKNPSFTYNYFNLPTHLLRRECYHSVVQPYPLQESFCSGTP
jgi:hypothetical protein